jgi:hypothetical protein
MRRFSVLFAMLLLASLAVAPAQAARSATGAAHYAAGRYIVSFADEPAATYDGTIAGYPRTRPDAGKKLDPTRRVSSGGRPT